MNFKSFTLSSLLLTSFHGLCAAQSYEPGETLVLKTNLHPDMAKRYLYTINYNLDSLMPMCSEVKIVKKKKRSWLKFEWEGQVYVMEFDKHTSRSGADFDAVLNNYFGTECDEKTVAGMSEVDQKGIKAGLPYLGMTRQGIIYAMGRPPVHANPDLEAPSFTYWRNRFSRQIIHFDEQGVVSDIR